MAEMKAIILKIGLLSGLLILSISCTERRDIVDVPTHPDGWLDKSSDAFHGYAVTSSISKAENCQTCHGEDYAGGTSEVSCASANCHVGYPHPQGFTDPNSPDSHIQFIRNAVNWDITTCKGCHGVDYAGNGSSDKNCLKCHSKSDGPENCTVCHGGDNAAPPEDLAENTETLYVTVGAHQAHVTGSRLTTNIMDDCTVCHSEVPVFDVASHVNDGSEHAEVNFSDFGGEYQSTSPTWDRNSATCSNVYCHGAFEFPEHDGNFGYADSVISGTFREVKWNSVGSNQAVCGSCHGLPPEGHIEAALNECVNCHANVVDENLNIVGKDLHIDGKIGH